MKNAIVSEAPAEYGKKRSECVDLSKLHRNAVLLHGVSWNTFEKLIEETGEHRKCKFAYDRGEFEIRTDLYSNTESRVILHGVSWNTYKTLLKELGESRNTRIAFDNGELEIMAPHFEHQSSNLPFEIFLLVLVEEFGLEYLSLGNLTFHRENFEKGMEPDCCFYIRSSKELSAIVEFQSLDHYNYPPADLMIEVDMTHISLNKLPICAALGVPEHWRFDGEKLEIRVLKNGKYVEVAESAAFPKLPLKEALPKFILSSNKGLTAMSREFRRWVRRQLKKNNAPRSAGKKRP